MAGLVAVQLKQKRQRNAAAGSKSEQVAEIMAEDKKSIPFIRNNKYLAAFSLEVINFFKEYLSKRYSN